MTVDSRTIDRSDLEGKVLPELQQIAQSLGVEGHQRLRKSALIEAIVAKSSEDGHGGVSPPATARAKAASRSAVLTAETPVEGAAPEGAQSERAVAEETAGSAIAETTSVVSAETMAAPAPAPNLNGESSSANQTA